MTTPPYVILSDSEESRCHRLTLTFKMSHQLNRRRLSMIDVDLDEERIVSALYVDKDLANR